MNHPYGLPIALHPEKEEVYAFMTKLMEELFSIFPDSFVHIGTDETPEACYKNFSSSPSELFSKYVNTMHGRIQNLEEKNIVMWDEALKANPPVETSVMQVWRKDETVLSALQKGYRVISAIDFGSYL